ncbi:MAG TPA: hypothetical protein VF304_03185 [Casimicrobiaceae bacterium]
MKRVATLLGAAGMLTVSSATLACGVCVGDKVAVTYDHAVVRAAIEARRQVVFVALDGPDATRAGTRIAAAATRVKGVDRASLRYAPSPPAFSFALAQGAPPDAAVAAFRSAVGGMKVRMTVIRLMRDGALVDPQ